MARKKPLSCTIGYETKDGTEWKACILAYSVKQAVEFLQRNVKEVVRINTTEGGKEIDAFETQVMKDFFTENVVEQIEVEIEVPVEVEVEVPVEVIKEVYIDREVPATDGDPTCPWCKKTFKSENTLKTHCIKFHLKED